MLVNGKSVTGPGPERAFVFQDFALLPWATVLRNVAFGLELRGLPRPEREAIARAQIAEVGLSGAEHKYPYELSGGMRQRVGLARALAVDAEILLMDEPFASVDEQNRRKFQEDLLRLLAHENKTVIFVTHSIEEAVYISDQVAVLTRNPGRLSRVVRPEIDRRAISTSCGARPPISTASTRSGASSRATSTTRSPRHDRLGLPPADVAGARHLGRLVGDHRQLELIMLIPPLSAVFGAMGNVLMTRSFLEAIGITLEAFAIGMGLSLVIGIGVGVAMGRSRAVGDVMGMWINIFEKLADHGRRAAPARGAWVRHADDGGDGRSCSRSG